MGYVLQASNLRMVALSWFCLLENLDQENFGTCKNILDFGLSFQESEISDSTTKPLSTPKKIDGFDENDEDDEELVSARLAI